MENKINLETGAMHWKEGPRRMTPLKTKKANEEVRELIWLGLIDPSYLPWACGIVMFKKKANQLCMCCDFRKPLKTSSCYPMLTNVSPDFGMQIALRPGDGYKKTACACEVGLLPRPHGSVCPDLAAAAAASNRGACALRRVR